MEWNKSDISIRNSASCIVFKKVILKFIRPESNQVFNVNNIERLKFLAKIRLRLIYLSHHEFTYSFQDCVKPIRSCGQEMEMSTLFYVCSSRYYYERQTLLEKVNKIDLAILKQAKWSSYNTCFALSQWKSKSCSKQIYIVWKNIATFFKRRAS